MASRFNLKNVLGNIENHLVAAFAIAIIMGLLMPVPGVLLDLMMIANISISVIVLLVVLYTPKSSDFTSFPRVLLFATLYGLALNVCSTRLILQRAFATGYRGFPGQMLKAFSSIVTGDSIARPSTTGLVIGMVIFIILIIIQVIVITKGATRVSEVAARFSLDAMNQKFFAVDSELNSGYITDEEARNKKAAIQRDIDFYSSMDGASKFVSGNVKAGIFITAIDLIAGIIVGVSIGHMPFGDAAGTYSRLTIGDGLLGQLPSLLLSFATGLIVTGNSSEEVLGKQLKKQLTNSGYVYIITGVTLALMSFIPNFPWYLLLPVGALFIFYGYRLIRSEKASFAKKLEEEQKAKTKSSSGENGEVSPVVPLDDLCLELGYALIPLVDKEKGAELLERVTRIRREAALDLGLVVPKIRIIDNMTLAPDEYSFKIKGIEAGRSKIKLGYYMCMNTGSVTEEIKGEATTDPAFGVPAIWVSEDQRSDAERAGYVIVDPPTIIATHITEIIRAHAAEILGRLETKAIIDKIKEKNPVVVDEVLNTYKYTYGDIERVLQGLLREQVSIRNIVAILETLANYGNMPHNNWLLIEKVREALGQQICLQYVDPHDPNKKLSVLQVSQTASEMIMSHCFVPNDGGQPFINFNPVDGRKWISAVSAAVTSVRERNYQPILLCGTPELRQLVRNSISREMPGVIALSLNEVVAAGSNVNLEILGEINV
ncbi:flagellar biosynthesis protein FlhA [Treponema sp.]|uniref:flagellar biosynthesis protein FlhA n=1 Tax=Treponema sp. TaxID=166 RepID=UPI0025DC0A76|nr:flagellar biosynthesis protein FlhA [Treponema sp.]MBR4323575.1 FHIPEP family type III secretion protein [Treponema sp.]